MPRVARDQEGAPMPNRETAPIGAPCWVGLTTADLERSRAFYCQLFGWTAEEPVAELGGYVNFAKDGVRVAGCMASQPGSGALDVWSVYLATDDAEKTLAAATAHGGQVHVPAMAVDDLGIMAFIGDPGGAGIGLWQPGMFPGFGVLGEPGTPSWFELHPRLCGHRRLLPRRLPLADQGRQRHPGVPLHGAAGGRGVAGRSHGRHRPPRRGSPRALVDLLRGRRHRRRASPGLSLI